MSLKTKTETKKKTKENIASYTFYECFTRCHFMNACMKYEYKHIYIWITKDNEDVLKNAVQKIQLLFNAVLNTHIIPDKDFPSYFSIKIHKALFNCNKIQWIVTGNSTLNNVM